MSAIPHPAGCGCERHDAPRGLMSVDEAVALAVAQVAPVTDSETLPLHEALGRTVAAEAIAPEAMPFFDNSGMDGFAVRTEDFRGQGPWVLPVAATIAAGAAAAPMRPGTVQRIFTGAPVPEGADAVVAIEETRDENGCIIFSERPKAGQNIRIRGSDMGQGAVLVRPGTRLSPRHLGLLAANGIARVAVARRARVAVLSTGDEVTDGPRGAGQVFDANRPMLCALARAAGAEVTDLGILPDEEDATAARIAALAGRFDLVLSSGAVSMGGKDFLRPAFEAAGGTVAGWRVAIKPGKPVMFGRIGQTAFTGLPGNPFAVFVGFHLFAAAQLRRLAGSAPVPFAHLDAVAGFDWTRSPGRAEVFPVRISGRDEAGRTVLTRLGASVSATLFPLAEADGLAFVPAGTARVVPGDTLDWRPFAAEGAA